MNDDIAVQMDRILDDIAEDASKASRAALKSVTKQCVSKLKATSPKGKNTKQKGRYAKGWRARIEETDAIVYNATDPGLTHLLEKGHVIVKTGKRSKAVPHIKPVEEWAAEELPRAILEDLGR